MAPKIAARQRGVVTYAQLLACGLSPSQIEHRVAEGWLQRLWRGVYAFGHRDLTTEGRLIAAALACGTGACVSHGTAAAHWDLLRTAPPAIQVTVAGRGTRAKRPGIQLHCVRRLAADDVTTHRGVPVTTVARTLVDLAAVAPPRVLERAYDQAQVLRLVRRDAILEALERAVGRRTRPLRRLLDTARPPSLTRSELEERFLTLVRQAGLPEPDVNARLHGYEVDFLWRNERRIVEVDGYAFHSVRGACYRQVVLEPDATLERTKRLLDRQ